MTTNRGPYPDEGLTGSTRVETDGVVVEKRLRWGEDEILQIEFDVDSNRSVPVDLRLRDRLPDGFPVERVGFHADYDRDDWSIEDGPRVVHETRLPPGADFLTIYAIKPRDGTDPTRFEGEPTIEITPDGAEPIHRSEDTMNDDTENTDTTESTTNGATDDVIAQRFEGDGAGDDTLELEESHSNGTDEGTTLDLSGGDSGVDLERNGAATPDAEESSDLDGELDVPPDPDGELDIPSDPDSGPDATPEDDTDDGADSDSAQSTASGTGSPADAASSIDADSAPSTDEAAPTESEEDAETDATPEDSPSDADSEGGTDATPDEETDSASSSEAESASTGEAESASTGEAESASTGEAGSTSSTEAESTSTGESASTDESVLEALVDELESEDVSEAQLSTLRDRLAEPTSDSGGTAFDVRLQRVERNVNELSAYTDALEEFLNERGTGQQALADFEDRIDDVESQVDTWTDDLDDRLSAVEAREERIDDLEAQFETMSESLEAIESTGEDALERAERNRDAVESLTDRVDVVEDEYVAERDDLREELEAVVDDVEEIRNWHSQFARLLNDFAMFAPQEDSKPTERDAEEVAAEVDGGDERDWDDDLDSVSEL